MSPFVPLSLAAAVLPQRMSPVIGAETQADVLGRSLVIALLVVAPYGVYKIRQVRRVRAGHQAAVDAERAAIERAERFGSAAPRPALEDVIRDISFVVEEANRSGGAMLVVPHDVTVSDRDAPRSVIDTLIRDALRRSGLVVTAELDSAEGRLLECALVNPGQG